MKTLVDRYRLDYAIGAGGLGIVWRARDLQRQCTVAIKEVRLAEALAPAERAALAGRATREAEAAARLRHPAIVTVHEVVLHDELPWIVMDLVEGRSLDERVRADGPLPPAEAAELGLTLLEALGAAHAAGVVHGDVKPANVLIGPDGAALLTDFTLAATIGDGVPLGDPAYIAPERRRNGEGGPGSDLFSLGATLAFAATGRDPMMGAEGDGPLDAAVRALMNGDPKARPSARAARNALLVAAGREPEEDDAPPPPEKERAAAADQSDAADETSSAAETRAPDADGGPVVEAALRPEIPSADAQVDAYPPASEDGERTGALLAVAMREMPVKRRRRPGIKTAVLVGVVILALLIGIGTLGRNGGTPSEAAQGAPATSPSTGSDSPPPTPAAADVAPPSASTSVSTSASATKPARTKTTTAAPKAAVLSAKIETDPARYTGACTIADLEIQVTITITVNQPGTKVTYTATGRGTRTVTTTGSTYTTTYSVPIDNSRRREVPFGLSVTSPSTASDATVVTNDCARS
ncbi:protein kinase domain-containing protein [Dactylosporangium sp. CA-139066]|uniref:serine/threonine-protein kinase n=1 Tax=Dactylosporangium sp. CA-139066 TaxID=3239930 RepID=UPI003D8E1E0A